MDKRVKVILKYMQNNLEKRITLKNISEISNLSYSYFSKLFKREARTNFSQCLKKMRIKKAKMLLKENSLSLKEITLKTGFRHVSSFCKEFKSMVGTSPSAYKRKFLIYNVFKRIIRHILKFAKKTTKIANRKQKYSNRK